MKASKKCLFKIQKGTKLTFDDVFLSIWECWSIKSRKNVDLSVEIKNLKLNLPLMMANMSSVSHYLSCRYMALMWWIWFIHQNMNLEDQIDQIEKVKRYWSPIVYEPKILDIKSTLNDCIQIFNKHSIWAIIIVDNVNSKIVKWIITKRDIYASKSIDEKSIDYMTKLENLKYISSETSNININNSQEILKKSRFEQLPIINKKWVLIWLFTKKGLEFFKNFKNASRDKHWNLVVWVCVWMNRNPVYNVEYLIKAWADIICVDTAHAWSKHFLEIVKQIRNEYKNILIIAWNTDNPKWAYDLIKAWADIIKIWVWPWWACTTRIKTWVWTPQISAILEIKEMLYEKKLNNIKLIWDWWIRNWWNLAKVLVAGANYWMIWSILAWTDLAPWELREINWKFYKDFRWMWSFAEAKISNTLSWKNFEDDYWPIFDEWANDIIPYKWENSFINTIRNLYWWIASSLSYNNSKNLEEFYQKSRFSLQTLNWFMEWTPHAFSK